MQVHCKACGDQFETFPCHVSVGNNKGTLCGKCRPTLADRKRRVAVKCAQCGTDQEVKQSEYNNSKEKRFYCGRACMGLWRSANNVGEAHPNYTGKIEVRCAVCDTPKDIFPSQTKDRKVFFCSDKCKGKWHSAAQTGVRRKWIDVKCSNCGETTSLVKSRSELYDAHFCSPECLSAWRSAIARGSDNPNFGGGFESRCDGCGKILWVRPSRIGDAKHFCSKTCANRNLSAYRGSLSSAWRGGNVKKRCKICNKKFEVKPAEDLRGAMYCSHKCAGIAVTKIRTEVEKVMIRINRSMGWSIWGALKGTKNGRRWQELVGYTVVQLKDHIESQFTEGMNWSNWGVHRTDGPPRWHIDHIRPRWSFSFSSAEDPQFRQCWCLANLQPLWGPENLEKSGKWDGIVGSDEVSSLNLSPAA